MQLRPNLTIAFVLVGMIASPLFAPVASADNNFVTDTSLTATSNSKTLRRLTPLVKAIEGCRKSVVNLRGRKSVPADPTSKSGPQKLKQVNGMGTGVVIDSRGYVLTNYHVVEGVRVIEVTTSEREKTTAKLMAHDPVTDLAILKIETKEPLPPIKIGTSSDLMLAEEVSAVGNAYGYEHTVTTGIVSALSRTVQVNDEQIYRNLIQTDTAINPGNSGGPLLNVNGEMIGIVVAVRIGAQGIAFAIPVNDALETASELMSEILPNDIFHGLSLKTVYENNEPKIVVDSVDSQSPASEAGIKSGDQIFAVNGKTATKVLDFQSSLLDVTPSSEIRLGVVRDDSPTNVVVKLERSVKPNRAIRPPASSIAWKALGVMLTPVSEKELIGRHPNYKRGLRIEKVRPNSPAEAEGMMEGDILVAMHGWKTESLENMAYILQRDELKEQNDFMFYILRDKEPLWGKMRVANLPR